MERVLDFSPQFHRGGDLPEVAQAICDTALETFGSDGAQLHSLEGLTFELLALAPESERLRPGLTFTLTEEVEAPESLHSRRPDFWPDVRRINLKGNALRIHHELNTISAILVPIVNLDETVGVLFLTWDHQIERPSEELFAIMQRFADQAGIAWQAALRVEAQRQADRLRETLDRVLALAPTFHITGSREDVAKAICDAALETFDCTAAAMYRIEGDRLRVLARVPYVKALHEGLTFPLGGEMPLARELRSRTPAFVADVTDPARSVQPWPPEVVRRAGTRSASTCLSGSTNTVPGISSYWLGTDLGRGRMTPTCWSCSASPTRRRWPSPIPPRNASTPVSKPACYRQFPSIILVCRW